MILNKHRLLLGAHLPIKGGLHEALRLGKDLGCTTIQFFTKSNRQWLAKKITAEEVDTFKKIYAQSTIYPLIAHASYLINIGSPHAAMAEQSCHALKEELIRCDTLGIHYLVLHPGSHLNTDEQTSLERIADYTTKALREAGGSTVLLFETTAGQGSAVGYTFEHLAYLVQHSFPSNRIGICVDTCHIFAAGYDFRTTPLYKKMWDMFDATVGMKYLKALHCNDSTKSLGSYVDRHADIGSGTIGIEAFRLLMNDPALFDIPKIIETPLSTIEDHKRNMNLLSALLSPATKSILHIV